MRTLLLVCLMTGACSAQPTPPTTASEPTSQPATGTSISTDDLLDAMEKVGQNLHTLTAHVKMAARDVAMGNDEAQNGTIWIQRLPDGDTRGRVRFDDRVVDNNKRFIERQEFLLDGDWVIQRNYGRQGDANAQRTETWRQVRKPGDKTDLLKLGEGPFPLPIGQPRERVKEQFEVNRLPDDADHPGLVVLELRPKPTNRLSRRFETITVWVDPADALPRVVQTVEPEPSSAVNTTTLSDVKINAGVADADFKLEPIKEDEWQVTKVPYE